jgi:CHRD domain
MHIGKRAFLLLPVAGLALIVAALPTVVLGQNDKNDFRARMIGVNEVPSINTEATATVRLHLSSDKIDFTLRYQNLKGGNPPLFSHIHIGQQHTLGGVAVFFCGGGGKPACPAAPATVSGTIVAADVVGPATQGVAVGNLADVERMIRLGASYSNLHTTQFPTGEIRGKNVPVDGSGSDQDDKD